MATAAKIKELEGKRTTIHKKFVRIEQAVQGWTSTTTRLEDVDLQLIGVQELRAKLDLLYDNSAEVISEADFVTHDADFITKFAAIDKVQGDLMVLKNQMTKAGTMASPSFKLDRIKLPKFSGGFTEWQSFNDLFSTSVDKNPTLSNVEKFVHLKSCLVGDAAAIISSYPVTDASYTEALDCIRNRYSNHREVMFAHLKKLDDFKTLTTETASGLRSLSDTVNQCVRSLKAMELPGGAKIPVDQWDIILVYHSLKKLDPVTRKEWMLEEGDNIPTLKAFLTLIEDRARALVDSTPHSSTKKTQDGKPKSQSSHHASPRPGCPKCSESHFLFSCPEYRRMSIDERRAFVRQKQLCSICCKSTHPSSTCTSKYLCTICGGRHSVSLCGAKRDKTQSSTTSTHEPTPPPTTNPTPAPMTTQVPVIQPDPTPKEEPTVRSSVCAQVDVSSHVVLLGTLLVDVIDGFGDKPTCRVFMDPGSEVNFVSEECVDMLGLPRKKNCIAITGIGGYSSGSTKGTCRLSLLSRVRDFQVDIEALILDKLTGIMPRSPCQANWSHLKGIDLADPQFHKPGRIDILMGAPVAASLMIAGILHGPIGSPVAQNTQFGWMLSGSVESAIPRPKQQISSHHVRCLGSTHCLDDTLQKFWKLEEPDNTETPYSQEDKECEQHFLSTHTRNPDGGYTVSLPFRPGAPPLGDSRESALKRFLSVERKFHKTPQLKEEYQRYMKEYSDSDFLEPVPPEELIKSSHQSYYLPHHVVVKESSSTTKYRVVFDASSKTTSGVSLNDVLLTGPKIQVDLIPLLIRFRSHLVAVSADIEKFYPQFSVVPSQRDFQRFLWRESSALPIQDFRLKRLTFGVTCAPYLAIRCLHQLSEDEQSSFPLAAPVLKRDFLVDNLLSGANNIPSALALLTELLQIMDRGKLRLRKWLSNSEDLVQSVPPEEREINSPLKIEENEVVKTIGILWYPVSDTFSISIVVPDLTKVPTKRTVLSAIARIFDPLGWLSPVTIKSKILMQELWKLKLDWDTPLPPPLAKQWLNYCLELKTLEEFRLDRCITRPPQTDSSCEVTYELHGFSDGSKDAYSAVVYLKTIDHEGNNSVKLVMAKAKVAPIRSETCPRLELCGAVLLAKSMKVVQEALDITFSTLRCWSDNTGVLGWIVSKEKLPVFVANRVRTISELLPSVTWNHVQGDENPADAPSRGISAAALIKHPLWFHGPPWLSQRLSPGTTTKEPADPPNISSMVAQSGEPRPVSLLINTTSSIPKMKRRIGWFLRFRHNANPANRANKKTGLLSVLEISNAQTRIIRIVQSESFTEEIRRCQSKLISKTSVKFLTPFLDENGILRVGGRLDRSALPYHTRHPMLLPKKHNYTQQLVRHLHITHLHAAPQLLLSIVRQQFWVIGGKSVVREIVHSCVVCHRFNANKSTQLMAHLPSSRITPSRPFSQCGMDYAGPFLLCHRAGRNPQTIKSYVCIFICMATRAIHLEWSSDLTTASFVAALHRFISRRGLPHDLYCDGGTNFVGAKREIQEVIDFLQSKTHQKTLVDKFLDKNIQFHFNPPSSPHHGGLWEAGVKSMKHHLRRVIGERKLSIEEFTTLLSQVEACLNSRPISALSNDPNDFDALTPGHFLIGGPLNSLPQKDLTPINPGRLSRWQVVQQIQQHFWRRWSQEYISQLQSRPKWFQPQPSISVGTLVLLLDDDPSWGHLKWKLGRVVDTFPGSDDKVRVCDVKTPNGSVYRRPIVKLSPLPIEQ